MATERYSREATSAIGVDVGGTKINAGVVDRGGQVLHAVSLETLAGQADTGNRVAEAVDRLLEELEAGQAAVPLRGIGVGSAGQIDWKRGSIRFASELLPGYGGTQLRDRLRERFSLPAWVDNDVNVLALTEKRLGSAQGIEDFVCLALGTGVGGAIVSGGRLLHGNWGGAAELGHLSVAFDGEPCICGGRGCLEQYASGTNIAKRMRSRLRELGRSDEVPDAREVFSRWKAGDPLAVALMEETFAAIGTAMASLAHALNPRLFVIGGGVADAGEPFLSGIIEQFRLRAMPSFADDVRIEPAYRGNWSGMIGAALQAWEYENVGERKE